MEIEEKEKEAKIKMMEKVVEKQGVYDEDSQVIRCESSDGTSHYFYRTDFKKMVADGTLKINYNTDFLEEDDFESKTESEKLDTVADELYYRYTSQSENIGNVTDTRTNTEYPGCFFVELSQLDEKFAPQGAENILDAVNKSTEWNGRLEDAYKELFTLLDCIRAIQSDEQFNDYETSLASVFHSVGDYTEGSTNLTYLFADKETQTIYTNKKAYSSYAQLEQNLETIFKEKAYAVVYPELSKCVTNIPDADLQVWNHTIDQSFDTKDFVFAVSVDTKFSVADSMADEAENYKTYSKLMFPMLAGAVFGSVLWLIGMVWLTVTAGRKPKDEEIHLNGFDRWYTEIAAGTVIGIWLAGTIISGTLIANSSLGYSHAVVTVIVTCLICGTYTMAWFLIGYLSLIRRIKAGTLWKNSLIRKVLKWIGKCSGKLVDFARAFSRNTAEKIKVLLVGGAFLFLQFLIIGCGFTGAGVFLIILLIVDAAAVIFIIRKADGLDLIMDGLKKISDGELQYKIKTDTLTGISEVKSYNLLGKQAKRLNDANESCEKVNTKMEMLFVPYHFLQSVITKITGAVIVAGSAYFYINGTMSAVYAIGMTISAFMLYSSLECAGNYSSLLHVVSVCVDKANAILELDTMDIDGKEIQPENYDIRLSNVSFSYDKRKIIDDISLSIPQKTTTAIVGPSGGGKSTLCNLIARFWDVDSGEVMLGGVNVKDYSMNSLMRNFSFVFQAVYLFADTIENNIKFGRQDASHEEVVEAAKKACCHDFISKLPNGYDTVIGEGGATLSGGEKQRISIARAIMKDAPIVILDEATANVDPENEKELMDAVDALTKEKTIIMIAHRLKTVRHADQIVVVEKGRIAQQGTHEQLMKQEGIYKRFVDARQQAVSWKLAR